ncbi:MAG TPA: hypothetical protein VJ779_08800 [Acetobacteraceae bacterium]|jgi:hypothetical protein|nr:hypothetical protein [Acetobacteraceae bacterium]
MDEAVFLHAVAAAQTGYSEDQWERLPPGERALAIYREMRRIDPGSVRGLLFTAASDSGHA